MAAGGKLDGLTDKVPSIEYLDAEITIVRVEATESFANGIYNTKKP